MYTSADEQSSTSCMKNPIFIHSERSLCPGCAKSIVTGPSTPSMVEVSFCFVFGQHCSPLTMSLCPTSSPQPCDEHIFTIDCPGTLYPFLSRSFTFSDFEGRQKEGQTTSSS